MKRNDFINLCCKACLGGALLATALESCAIDYYAQVSQEPMRIAIPKSEFYKTDKKTGAKTKRPAVLVKSERLQFPIIVFQLAEGSYSALLMECTHRSCELQRQGNFLVCPCHNSEFTNTGVVQNPPAEQNLKSFKTNADNENVYILL